MINFSKTPFSYLFIVVNIIFLLFLLPIAFLQYKSILGETLGYTSLFVFSVYFSIIFPLLLFYQLYKAFVFYKIKYSNNFLAMFFYYLYFLFMYCTFLLMSPISIYFVVFFLLIYFIYLIYNFSYKFLFRYLFAFLAAISDLILKYKSSEGLNDLFAFKNEKFYQDNLYFIPLSFIVIQLCIELYFFIKVRKK